jgi:O-antigen/teichoic acid export membrane protein
VRLSRVGGLARRYIKFPVLSVPESLMEVGSREVPILLLGLLFTSEEVGHFSRARTLLSLPLWVLSAAVAQVYYQRVASVYAAGGSVRRITEQVAKRLLRYALPPFALLPLLGPGLFAFVLGRRWEEAGVFAALLAPLIFFRFAMRPLMQLVYVFERQGAGALFTALLLLTQGGGILLGAHLGSPRLAIGAASFSGGLLIAGFIAWLLRIAGVPLLRIVADLLRASLSTGLLLAGVYFFQRATELHYLAELAVAAVLLAGIYAFWIWRDPELLANLRRRDS